MRENPSAEGSGSLQKNIERTVQTSGFRERGFRPSPWATKASLSGARCQAHAGREFGSLTRLAKRVKHKPDESFENSFIPAARLGQTDLNPKPAPGAVVSMPYNRCPKEEHPVGGGGNAFGQMLFARSPGQQSPTCRDHGQPAIQVGITVRQRRQSANYLVRNDSDRTTSTIRSRKPWPCSRASEAIFLTICRSA